MEVFSCSKSKKAHSVFLTLVMLIGVSPMSVFAEAPNQSSYFSDYSQDAIALGNDYFLMLDIKGNGSNIRVFEVVKR